MVDPFRLHWYVRPVPVFAFKVTLPPAQKMVELAADIDALGGVPTVTGTADEVALQPPAVTTTV
jgi:hypothetical protein